MDNNVDEKIKQDMLSHTDVQDEEKQEIWNNIEQQLFATESVLSKKKRRGVIPILTSAAVVGLVLIGLQTNTGHALIDKVKTLFAPEKEIIQEMEGLKEETHVVLEQGSSEYVIYVDEERYKFVNSDDIDQIVPKIPLGEKYPEVGMQIQQFPNKSVEELTKSVHDDLKSRFVTVSEPKKVETPIKGWMVRGIDGQQWDSPIEKVYIISNGKKGSYVITQKYFLEAEEGHGARFYAMLQEFYIVDEEIK